MPISKNIVTTILALLLGAFSQYSAASQSQKLLETSHPWGKSQSEIKAMVAEFGAKSIHEGDGYLTFKVEQEQSGVMSYLYEFNHSDKLFRGTTISTGDPDDRESSVEQYSFIGKLLAKVHGKEPKSSYQETIPAPNEKQESRKARASLGEYVMAGEINLMTKLDFPDYKYEIFFLPKGQFERLLPNVDLSFEGQDVVVTSLLNKNFIE